MLGAIHLDAGAGAEEKGAPSHPASSHIKHGQGRPPPPPQVLNQSGGTGLSGGLSHCCCRPHPWALPGPTWERAWVGWGGRRGHDCMLNRGPCGSSPDRKEGSELLAFRRPPWSPTQPGAKRPRGQGEGRWGGKHVPGTQCVRTQATGRRGDPPALSAGPAASALLWAGERRGPQCPRCLATVGGWL